MEIEIQHSVHPEHPLILINLRDAEIRDPIMTYKEKHKYDNVEYGSINYAEGETLDTSIRCTLCRLKMIESSYSCVRCDVHLHMLCATLPTEMMYPNHKHMLTLIPRKSFRCDICCDYSLKFSYNCRSCDFDVDVRCASETQLIKHEGHEHPLHLFLSTALFKCSACTTVHLAGVSYKCRTCPFWVHEECALLPTTIKYNHHVHPLHLVKQFEKRKTSSYEKCKICDKYVSRTRPWEWSYECYYCPHRVHINCLAASLIAERGKTAYEVDGDIDMNKVFHLPESFQYADLIGQMINHTVTHYFQQEQMAMMVSQVDQPQLISHFSHQHPLTPTIWNAPTTNRNEGGGAEMKEKDITTIICNACMLPISTPQVYYRCSVSNNYFLHEWCAKLPNVLQHPTERDVRLTLDMYHENTIEFCNSCRCYTQGYLYRGSSKRYFFCPDLDIKCASLPPVISHKSHQHPLKLVTNCRDEGCVACPQVLELELAYGCKQCCFYLHSRCALQPITIVHRYDKHHPFTLIDGPIKDGPDEYVCEFCEEHIDPKWWFYHCLPCDLSACANCISQGRSKKWYVNPSVRYSTYLHHHTLSCVPIDYSNASSLCSACDIALDLHKWNQKNLHKDRGALRCLQCNIFIHEDCARFLKRHSE